MKPDTILQIGDFEISGTEIPERITFGGEQRLVVNKLVGGMRNVQALGSDPAPIVWSGLFFGATARDRARYVNTLKDAGKELDLIWDEFFYRVVIRDFRCDFERFHQLPYQITLEVVEDKSGAVLAIAAPSVDDLVDQDATTITGLSDLIGDSTLSGLVSNLNTAISSVSSIATAATGTINSIVKPLNAVRGRVQVLFSSVNNTVRSVTTLGGILPNNPISTNVGRILSQATAAAQIPILQQMDVTLGRMGKNLGSINSGTKTVTQAGGNLYRLAADEYGDAMGWTALAAANGTTDPVLTGVNTIVVPPLNQNTNGVLNA
ncbi:hypothetical protein [Herbaspirillum frisingense]|uniref:hypothetical protein n=1 Tax=Herbaspirillum frisingense TaxID=92645 RepID=UPI0039AFBF88